MCMCYYMNEDTIVLTRFNFHDHWFAILIPHLLDVQQFMGVTIVPRPAIHKDPGAATSAVHHQAIVQVGVACVCCLHVCHPCQVPSGQWKNVKITSASVPNTCNSQHLEATYGSGFPF